MPRNTRHEEADLNEVKFILLLPRVRQRHINMQLENSVAQKKKRERKKEASRELFLGLRSQRGALRRYVEVHLPVRPIAYSTNVANKRRVADTSQCNRFRITKRDRRPYKIGRRLSNFPKSGSLA